MSEHEIHEEVESILNTRGGSVAVIITLVMTLCAQIGSMVLDRTDIQPRDVFDRVMEIKAVADDNRDTLRDLKHQGNRQNDTIDRLNETLKELAMELRKLREERIIKDLP